MAVLSGATASARQLYQGQLPTVATSVYTAKGYSTNVVSDSGTTSGTTGSGPSTAYIKEIILCNTSANSAKATVMVGANSASNAILYNVSVPPGDSKFISGITTMIPAGGVIWVSSDTASAITITISGVEVN